MLNSDAGYKTPAIQTTASFIERKSEFIGQIKPVCAEKDALAYLEEIRAAHRKARHNCYAYILRENNISRYSDDGEPSGTAGIVILDALKKEGLTDVICVVTRYFGGILLGANGLVRAYSKAASLAVSAAGIKLMELAKMFSITMEYPLYGKAERVFTQEGICVIDRKFNQNVNILLYVKENISEHFKAELIDICGGDVVVECLQNNYCDFG